MEAYRLLLHDDYPACSLQGWQAEDSMTANRGGGGRKHHRRLAGQPFDPERAALELESDLRERGEPARAKQEKRYLKSEREHFGVSVPGIRAVVAHLAAEHPDLTRSQFLALVEGLWARPAHECRFAAVELLKRFRRLLEPTDLPLVERFIRESGTWALVDPLAVSVAGALIERSPELAEVLDHWARDPDFWVRRSALLALLGPLRRGGGDFARFTRYADAMLEEKEFFVRKAVGWVLRETAGERPELVHRWLLPRATRASGLTVREAVKHLPEAMRDEILAAREASRSRAGGGGPDASSPPRARRKT